MAHIESGINSWHRQASLDGVSVLLVDSHYIPRLRAAWGERQKKLEAEGKIRIVTVDETERYLNPTNFVVTHNHHVLMNHAPKTRARLLATVIQDDYLQQLTDALTYMPNHTASIGCWVVIALKKSPAILPAVAP